MSCPPLGPKHDCLWVVIRAPALSWCGESAEVAVEQTPCYTIGFQLPFPTNVMRYAYSPDRRQCDAWRLPTSLHTCICWNG